MLNLQLKCYIKWVMYYDLWTSARSQQVGAISAHTPIVQMRKKKGRTGVHNRYLSLKKQHVHWMFFSNNMHFACTFLLWYAKVIFFSVCLRGRFFNHHTQAIKKLIEMIAEVQWQIKIEEMPIKSLKHIILAHFWKIVF